jgi:hypothetical protein
LLRVRLAQFADDSTQCMRLGNQSLRRLAQAGRSKQSVSMALRGKRHPTVKEFALTGEGFHGHSATLREG